MFQISIYKTKRGLLASTIVEATGASQHGVESLIHSELITLGTLKKLGVREGIQINVTKTGSAE